MIEPTVLKRLVTGTLERSGAVGLMRRLGPEQPLVLALVYHRIGGPGDAFFPSVNARTFETQIAYIKQHYPILTLEEVTQGLAAARDLPRRSVVITLDEGYAEVATVAEPILRRLEAPAVCFLTTDCIGTGAALWMDDLAAGIKATGRVRCDLSVNGRQVRWHLGSVSARLACLSSLRQWLRSLPDEERRRAMQELARYLLVNGSRVAAARTPAMLTWEQVQTLHRGGWVTFGAHGRSSAILSRVARSVVWQEIAGSKEEIERRLGEPVTGFAYPGGRPGDLTDETETLVRQAGYATAWTLLYGVNGLLANPLRLLRLQVTKTHLPSFAVQLARVAMER